MKQSYSIIVFHLILLALLSGCRKSYILNQKQAILFQYEYIKHPGDVGHSGFLIDNEGYVLTYENPEGWHFPDNNMMIAEDNVAENISKCIHSGIRINGESLKKYSTYIPNISSSKVTALKNTGSDGGTTSFICYYLPQNSDNYKVFVIKKEGDYTCENLNFYTKKVITWLREIKERISCE